jgi:hypothetical protein
MSFKRLLSLALHGLGTHKIKSRLSQLSQIPDPQSKKFVIVCCSS